MCLTSCQECRPNSHQSMTGWPPEGQTHTPSPKLEKTHGLDCRIPMTPQVAVQEYSTGSSLQGQDRLVLLLLNQGFDNWSEPPFQDSDITFAMEGEQWNILIIWAHPPAPLCKNRNPHPGLPVHRDCPYPPWDTEGVCQPRNPTMPWSWGSWGPVREVKHVLRTILQSHRSANLGPQPHLPPGLQCTQPRLLIMEVRGPPGGRSISVFWLCKTMPCGSRPDQQTLTGNSSPRAMYPQTLIPVPSMGPQDVQNTQTPPTTLRWRFLEGPYVFSKICQHAFVLLTLL